MTMSLTSFWNMRSVSESGKKCSFIIMEITRRLFNHMFQVTRT